MTDGAHKLGEGAGEEHDTMSGTDFSTGPSYQHVPIIVLSSYDCDGATVDMLINNLHPMQFGFQFHGRINSRIRTGRRR